MNWGYVVEAIQRGAAGRFRYRVLCHPELLPDVRDAVSREPWADRVVGVYPCEFCEPGQMYAVKELPPYLQGVLRRR